MIERQARAVLLSVTMAAIPVGAIGQPAPAGKPASGGNNENPAATDSRIETTNSTANYNNDRMWWDGAVVAYDKPGGVATYCLPAETVVMGTKSQLDSTTPPANAASTNTGSASTNTTTAVTGSAQFQWQKVVLAIHRPPYFGLGQWHNRYPYLQPGKQAPQAAGDDNSYVIPGNSDCSPQITGAAPEVPVGQYFYIPESTLEEGYRYGWEYGVLAVPFKYQLSQGKDLQGQATLGGYLGFRIPFFETGVVISPIIFGGLSEVSTNEKTDSGTTNSQTLSGASYGTGLLFTIKDKWNVGAVLGFDHVSPSSNYQYNDKPWLSFEVGYSFAQ